MNPPANPKTIACLTPKKPLTNIQGIAAKSANDDEDAAKGQRRYRIATTKAFVPSAKITNDRVGHTCSAAPGYLRRSR